MSQNKPTDAMRNRAKSLRQAMTDEEKSLWYDLRELKHEGIRFGRQAPIGPYIVDFVCLKSKLVVEVDGSHHGNPDQEKHDQKRDAWLSREGFHVIRFWNDDLRKDRDLVVGTILNALPLEGGGGCSIFPKNAEVGGGER